MEDVLSTDASCGSHLPGRAEVSEAGSIAG